MLISVKKRIYIHFILSAQVLGQLCTTHLYKYFFWSGNFQYRAANYLQIFIISVMVELWAGQIFYIVYFIYNIYY